MDIKEVKIEINKRKIILERQEFIDKKELYALQFCLDLLDRVEEDNIEGVLKLRYHKLMHPDATEQDAEIVAGVLSTAITNYLEGK
jgi:hypothetical protein